MVKLLVQSYLIILAIPFITYALDPKDPKTICDRLVSENAKGTCVSFATSNNLDWYAAAACNELNDDEYFLKCWKQISGGKFNPETLDFCTKHPDDSDSDRLKCILSMKNKSLSMGDLKKCSSSKNISDYQRCFNSNPRSPASGTSEFQSLQSK